jgi:cytochrome c nitrite reductase small subunit
MEKLHFLKPPENWISPVSILLGLLFGLTLYILIISNSLSYLSDKPETCINCHIMKPQLATWQHSSHRETAVCNDCHVPHDNFVRKYIFKAKDGLRHASIFTLRKEPQVIFIKEDGKAVVQENCVRCHLRENEIVNTKIYFDDWKLNNGKLCWECHIEVPHGSVNSLSSVSFFLEEESEKVPIWIKKYLKDQ